MPVEQLERIGQFITLKEAARLKGTTTNALYLWMRNRGIAVAKVGSTILVGPEQIVEYERTWVRARPK